MKLISRFILTTGMVFLPHLVQAQLSIDGSVNNDLAPVRPDTIVQLAADSQGLQLVLPEQVPACGTFWWVVPGGAALPTPCPPQDLSGAIYQIADGQFLVDETGGQVVVKQRRSGLQAQVTSSLVASAAILQADSLVNLITQVQTTTKNQTSQTLLLTSSLDVSGPPTPGDGGSGDGSSGDTNSYPTYTFDHNQLWLEITNASNGWFYLNLHNATNQVYAIWSTTNLLTPFTNWEVETELWPTDTNCTPFTMQNLNRQDVFLRAEDWTGVTESGNITPDWWLWLYFKTLNLSDTNWDSQGNNRLSYDYTHGLDPNVIVFTAFVEKMYVNTSYPNVQLDISVGSPAYSAVLTNSTNQADAVWQPYTGSNVVATLGADGSYNVSIGLRGYAGNATETWQDVALVKDTVPPVITITNPAASTVSQPLIQVQGFANEPLASLTYDISNSTGIFTNLQGFLTGQCFDTNLLAYTTNYFQISDLDLGSGQNIITFHATDWAGNRTDNGFMVNYSARPNAPALTIIWPQADMNIGGDNFTVQAQVDNTASTITASIVDSNGNINTVQGLTEKNGSAWVQNLPLHAGTNHVTVTVTSLNNSASAVNFNVIKKNVGLVIYPLASDQLNQPAVSVFGAVDDPNYCVWVNGIQATVNDDGSWEADSVPVSSIGTACMSVQVYVGDPVLIASQNLYQAQPVTVGMMSYSGRHDLGFFGHGTETINWFYQTGGNYAGDEDYFEISSNFNGVAYADFVGWSTVEFNMPWEYASLTVSQTYETGSSYPYGNYTQTRVMVEPSGQTLSGTTNLYLVQAYASEFSTSQMVYGPAWGTYGWDYEHLMAGMGSLPDFYGYSGDTPLPPEWLKINGQTLINSGITNAYSIDDLGGWYTFHATLGETIVSAPAGVNWDVTPTATQVYQNQAYTFNVQAFDVTPKMLVDNNRSGNLDSLSLPNNPYRFWINDSQEGGDISSAADDIPGTDVLHLKATLPQVRGASDLVNFFPVALCLSNVLQLLPPTNGWEYHLSQADGAVNFVYTDLTRSNAFDYLTNSDNAVYGPLCLQPASYAGAEYVSASGEQLSLDFLNRIQADGNKGVILVEGIKATQKPLMLEIWHNGQKLAGVPLYLNIDGVEKMYRHKNLRDGADAPNGLSGDLQVRDNDASLPTQTNEPTNNPDSLSNGRWFIFVVGSNVGGQNSRGWESEVFKRMYWSGSKAKFVGVSWFGDPYTNSEGVYDYHMAVRNAFATSPALASFVNGLSGSKTIAGHSLGCGEIVAAIADSGMTVNNACLMDAAFAQECFDDGVDENLTAMQPSAWSGYSEGLFAANLFQRFDSSDARSTLTGRNRFANALNNGNVYSFYSSTEDALGEYDGEVPTTVGGAIITDHGNFAAYVWTYQEKAKGARVDYLNWQPFNISFHVGSTYGGWGFNPCDGYLPSYPVWYKLTSGGLREMKTPSDIGTVTQDLLDGSQYNPLFKNGWGTFNGNNPSEIYVNVDASQFTGPSWILGLYQPNQGSIVAADQVKNAQLLAEMIPALSKPVGANPCGNNALSGKQFNMATEFADEDHWPTVRGANNHVPKWWHSDMGQVAYPYLYKLYNRLVSISNQ